jgi:heme/copper-type cytochrome/quinol oxidase subunit 2
MSGILLDLLYVGIVAVIICVLTILTICLLVCIVRKRKVTNIIRALAICAILSFGIILFILSHPTWYTFNDWTIIGSHTSEVIDKYGEPDVGNYEEGKAGRIYYYIYFDNDIIPDFADHYYYIYYNEEGIVTGVKDSTLPAV